jgi:8-oxo-dGTP pyrophosphatase MutT (NUDIX family)
MDEAVFFLFIKDEKILLEHRTEESEEPGKIFIPCGGIEKSDHEQGDEYRVVAMKREIREELGEHITPTEYSFLTTVEKAETMKMFHSYLIRKWEGDLPEYSMEHGKQNAKLVWTDLDDAFLTIDSEVARMTVGKAISILRNGDPEDSY